jgi:hypothetical protein
VAKRNPRTGSRFDDFLKEEGMFEEGREADEAGHGKENGDQPLAARPGVGSKQRFGSVGYADQSSARSRQRDRDQDQTRPQKGGGMNGARGRALPDFCRSQLCTVVHGHAVCNGRDREKQP